MASAAASKSVERSTLLSEYRLDPNEAIQFRDGDVAKPWKKVALAIGLLALGSLLLSLGLGFWFTGQPNPIPLVVIGSVAFIPGSYYTRIAYLSWKGQRGYSLSSIPDV